MITVICATHRPKNQTLSVVKKYVELLEERGENSRLFRMDQLPDQFLQENTFDQPIHGLRDVLQNNFADADRLVVISPEYNGSYPGLFKAFLDATPQRTWRGKKVALVGVSSGRAGNLRGMDHLTDVFHHLRAEVFSFKVPISRLEDLLDNGQFTDEETLKVLRKQIDQFLQF